MSELNYKRNGDYLIPDLAPMEVDSRPLGKYGMLRKSFLRQNKPILWNELLLTGRLDSHLRDINETAEQRLEMMMNEMAEKHGVSESLKAQNPMEWVRQMNSIMSMAEEFVLQEVVYNI